MTTCKSALAGQGAPPHGVRLLKPVKRREEWPKVATDGVSLRHLIILDVETTGFDPLRHAVVELCAARIAIDGEGAVAAVECVRTGLHDPGHPMSDTIREITGLNDEDLAGQSIDPDALMSFLNTGAAVVAFNAGFDRPFIEGIAPKASSLRWGCAMRDIPWRTLGFEPGSQGYLLCQCGYFNPVAHRAKDDVLSLVQLMAHECEDGETVALKMLAAVDGRQWRFEAPGAVYNQRHELKDRGYRWSAQNKLWHKVVRGTEFRREYRWYKSVIGQRPAVVPLLATERYRADHTWKPKPPKKMNLEWPEGDPF